MAAFEATGRAFEQDPHPLSPQPSILPQYHAVLQSPWLHALVLLGLLPAASQNESPTLDVVDAEVPRYDCLTHSKFSKIR